MLLTSCCPMAAILTMDRHGLRRARTALEHSAGGSVVVIFREKDCRPSRLNFGCLAPGNLKSPPAMPPQ
ncbi:hypothetical protein PIB19_05350 [Sphingomonas sp. 7/4-4]|uniref:hypothetical protein n=1 Tax=Sphingomonas sp. 7/4-4 TaxID=3018446 RepID=UPI0022F400BB|nr:hypothetical protein [Sphingomonas sp. 7/4-4]WBY08846.1 hypothetical protein PIB19_05350 [Sphingomonas sp. 7/4-4]